MNCSELIAIKISDMPTQQQHSKYSSKVINCRYSPPRNFARQFTGTWNTFQRARLISGFSRQKTDSLLLNFHDIELGCCSLCVWLINNKQILQIIAALRGNKYVYCILTDSRQRVRSSWPAQIRYTCSLDTLTRLRSGTLASSSCQVSWIIYE